MSKIRIVACQGTDGTRDGSNGWNIEVDGITVVYNTYDLDIANYYWPDVLERVGVALEFDWDSAGDDE